MFRTKKRGTQEGKALEGALDQLLLLSSAVSTATRYGVCLCLALRVRDALPGVRIPAGDSRCDETPAGRSTLADKKIAEK